MPEVNVKVETSAEPTDNQKLLAEIKRLFSFCENWESNFRGLYVEDDKFGHADSDNQWQWPDQMLTDRALQQKPTLTVNKVRTHCLQIINDAKQNKPGIVVHPTSTDATYEGAQVFEDVIRHIEYQSRAQEAYDEALTRAVYGGYGGCRVVTDYIYKPSENDDLTLLPPDAWDQELLIKGIRDPLTVYIDPDAKEIDKSDMEYAFVFDDMPREKFNRLYPDHKDIASNSSLNDMVTFDGWLSQDHVRVAEYWRKKHDKKAIVSVVSPQSGERVTWDKKDVAPETLRKLRTNPDAQYREREVDIVTVEWFKVAGDEIIDHGTWPGQYIPIVMMVGEETVIDGQMDRKGHVRYLKDPQRIYNWMTSSEVEVTALQTKTPWKGPAETFESYEEYYQQANTQNLAFLPYKAFDDDGNALPAPERVNPPVASEALLKGMQTAEMEMMMASGQYQAQFGANENAKSGKAISERQRQGDNATYHFIDNQAAMIRQIGRILVDVIPHFYDTRRLLRIEGEDGMMRNIMLDPEAQMAAQMQEDAARREVNIIFNPNMGRYGVEADIGPSFATRRQEAWNAIVQILSQNATLTPIIADLLFQNGDFPGADEIAKRLRRMVPKQALQDGPTPQDEAMQQQMQQLMGMVQQLNAQLKDKTAETNIKGFEASVRAHEANTKAFDAETKRLTAIGNAGPIVTSGQVQPVIDETISQMLGGGEPQDFGAMGAQ